MGRRRPAGGRPGTRGAPAVLDGCPRAAVAALGALTLLGPAGCKRHPAPPPAGIEMGATALAQVRAITELGPRFPGGAGYAPALPYLTAALKAHAASVEVVELPTPGGRTVRHVLARFHPQATSGRVLLASHWDTRGVAEADPDPARRDEPVPGANDGASGVAVLLALAPRLAALPRGRPGVDVVLFDGEEALPGREDWVAGSRAWAATLPRPTPWRGALVLDMVCRTEPPIRREWLSNAKARALTDLVFRTAREAAPGGPFEDAPGPRVLDDHVPLMELGVPAVLLIGHGDPAWHTTADTADRCDPAALGAVAVVVLGVVESLASEGGR